LSLADVWKSLEEETLTELDADVAWI
jgi:hypothetical protein